MAPSAEPAWTITTQVETTDLGPAGTFVQGVKVNFRTRSGALGSVFIPSDQYSVARVRDEVGRRAATMDEVAGLQG